MFDIGFSEILMFGAMALIVLGPEKLPQAARSAGKWYAKIRFTIANIQREVEQELDITETRRVMQKELAKIREAEASMQKELAEIRGNVQSLHQHQEKSTQMTDTDINARDPIINDTQSTKKQSAIHDKDTSLLSPIVLPETSLKKIQDDIEDTNKVAVSKEEL